MTLDILRKGAGGFVAAGAIFLHRGIRAGATEPDVIISEVVSCRGTEAFRAPTERLSANAFRLPCFIVAFRSAKECALRDSFTEQKSTSTPHRVNSPPLHAQGLGVRTNPELAEHVQHQDADQASRSSASSTLTNLLSAAQQYLQALRECMSPPHDLCEAWEAFYKACDPLVRRTVVACCMDRAEVDDLIQEAWAEIAAKLTRFEYNPNRGFFEAWLRIVVHRTACRHARRDLRQTAGRIDTDLSAFTSPRILGPAMATQREELRASVRETLGAFRPRVSRTAFQILVLTTVQGQTSTEIGKRLGLSPVNVRVTRHRTVKKFRQFVAAQPALAEALDLSSPQPNAPAATSKNHPPDEFKEFSENSSDPQ